MKRRNVTVNFISGSSLHHPIFQSSQLSQLTILDKLRNLVIHLIAYWSYFTLLLENTLQRVTILDIMDIWVRVLIEEPPLIVQTDTFVLLHLIVLYQHIYQTDDTAHTDTFYNTTIAQNRTFGAANTNIFAILPYFIGRIDSGPKCDISKI